MAFVASGKLRRVVVRRIDYHIPAAAPAFAIRKPAVAVFTLAGYVAAEVVSAEQADTLQADTVRRFQNATVDPTARLCEAYSRSRFNCAASISTNRRVFDSGTLLAGQTA